ncbi:Imidazolonepropionase [Thalassocella blandensis]|nr:Imidazolonepropionase [Thalassocella blandensis]
MVNRMSQVRSEKSHSEKSYTTPAGNLDGLIYNATVASFDPHISHPYGMLRSATLGWRHGKIVLLNEDHHVNDINAKTIINAKGHLVTPGFIDCHTHAVFGGNRAQEFEWRLQGQSYREIAEAGGGIQHTVEKTRQEEEITLLEQAKQRLLRLHRSGVTSVEVKSGYGLNLDTELKMLQVIRALNEKLPINVVATCLAAHALPKDFNGSSDDYIDWVCQDLLPQVKERDLADAVDVFCESIAFNTEQAARLFSAAKELGFAVKGHVEQLSQSGGTDTVCRYHGLSADHIEYADESQVMAMKRAGVVGVLLPGAFYYLKEKQLPPIASMRKHKVPMAIATDLNPGSSPIFSITHAANMACVLFGLTPEEALQGITINAAKALKLEKNHVLAKGVLKVGADADFVLWPIKSPVDLVYELPAVEPEKIWINGESSEYL